MTLGSSVGRHAAALASAAFFEQFNVGGMRVEIPGGRIIRWSVVAGNMRLHRLLDEVVRPGDTVVDVGANIGYNTVYAGQAVGPSGRVVAIEPAGDNLEVLRRQVAANGLHNVTLLDVAAGRTAEDRPLYLRGAISAVNSLYPEGCYGPVTGTAQVRVRPLDDLLDGPADVVKIDVEGAELDVLGGMRRLLQSPSVRLIVEWHPALQVAAGYEAEALPAWLLSHGFSLHAVWHFSRERLTADRLRSVAESLLARRRPVELLACR